MSVEDSSSESDQPEDAFDPHQIYYYIHYDHCSKCYLLDCQEAVKIDCKIVHCPNCKFTMHNCKMIDHLETICSKAFVPCLNVVYGCDRLIRRDRMSAHLEYCTASIMVCTREWCRRVVSQKCKSQMKRWGKRFDKMMPSTVDPAILDISLALHDQKDLTDSYRYSRKSRNHQRDHINLYHPAIPLKPISDTEGHLEGPIDWKGKDEADSSDEEREAKAVKLRKKREMFANCYMCQVDPASQHLHTLGNDSAKYKAKMPIKKREFVKDPFHIGWNLMINYNVDFCPEYYVKGDNDTFIKNGGTLYTKKCLQTFRRCELSSHHHSQHLNSMTRIHDIIARCPNWMRGCQFYTHRLEPKYGTVRFDSNSSAFSILPLQDQVQISCSNPRTLEDMPDWAILEICKHLTSYSLKMMSYTCKLLRDIVLADPQIMTSVQWKKKDGQWKESGFTFNFSVSDSVIEMKWQPAGKLSDHMNHCEYMDLVTEEERLQPTASQTFKDELKVLTQLMRLKSYEEPFDSD